MTFDDVPSFHVLLPSHLAEPKKVLLMDNDKQIFSVCRERDYK